MIKKSSRLTKETIENKLIRARRGKTAHFLVMYGRDDGAKTAHISFSASKKIAPSAVVRNRLRRRGYSALRPLLPRISPALLALFSYTAADTNVSIKELSLEISEFLSKIGAPA